jgi:ferredoxin
MAADLPLPEDLPLDGAFSVDGTSCIDCFLCRDLAPKNFARDKENEVHHVCKQPETIGELDAVVDALESCPTKAIRYQSVPVEAG